MIILDTNVVSEPIRIRSEQAVIEWLDRQAPETLYLTAVNLAELLAGAALLPAGKRRDSLRTGLDELVERLFGSRILPFDEAAAKAYASVVSRAKASGHTISVADAQIAAIAEVHGFTVATRDTGPFAAAGATVLNPWKD